MNLRSFGFNHNTALPPRYRSVNPPLDIFEVPDTAKSLALIMHDPDAVSGDFTHWTIWDIDPKTTEILEGASPSGSTEGITTAGVPGYVGPRPPKGSGDHRYTFDLYALDTTLDLLPTTPADDLLDEINKHVLAQATLIGTIHA